MQEYYDAIPLDVTTLRIVTSGLTIVGEHDICRLCATENALIMTAGNKYAEARFLENGDILCYPSLSDLVETITDIRAHISDVFPPRWKTAIDHSVFFAGLLHILLLPEWLQKYNISDVETVTGADVAMVSYRNAPALSLHLCGRGNYVAFLDVSVLRAIMAYLEDLGQMGPFMAYSATRILETASRLKLI